MARPLARFKGSLIDETEGTDKAKERRECRKEGKKEGRGEINSRNIMFLVTAVIRRQHVRWS